jgi:hypothetical protein
MHYSVPPLVFVFFFSAWGANSYGQTFESSNLPLLLIDTKGQEIPNEPNINATIRIIDNGAGKMNTILISKALPTSGAEVQFLGLEVDGKRVVVRKILRE